MTSARQVLQLGGATLGLWLGLTGCTFISTSLLEERSLELDEDGDGVPRGGDPRDCDDNNAEVFPGNPEIPYDGQDNDCLGGDVVDIDGDGFPGISREDYLAANPDADWPANVASEAGFVDCVDDPALDSRAAQIFPGNTNDVPYDGVDSNCGRDNDFDVDDDGTMPEVVVLAGGETLDVRQAFADYVAAWGYEAELGSGVFGDCDDLDAEVGPTSTVPDVPYDGIDQDCDGANDFDADGDGAMPGSDDPELNELVAEYDAFVDRYWRDGAPPWGAAVWGDCLDVERPELAVDPAQVGPAMVEVYFDGVDGNCDGANDFDEDGDGWMPSGVLADYQAYVEVWGYSYPEHDPEPQVGDCDDADRRVKPDALESLGDAIDADCDGGPDTGPFGFSSFTWTDPRPPRIARDERHFVVSTVAAAVDLPEGGKTNVGAALFFGPQVGAQAEPDEPVELWQGEVFSYPLGVGHDLAVSDGVAWASTTYENNGRTWLIAAELEWQITTGEYVVNRLEFTNTTLLHDGSDVELVLDSRGDPWVVSCGLRQGEASYVLQVLKGTPDASSDEVLSGLPRGEQCFWRGLPEPSRGLLDLCGEAGGGGCQGYEFLSLFEALEPLAEDPSETPAWHADAPFLGVELNGTVHAAVDLAGAVQVYGPLESYTDVLPGWTASQADATLWGGDLFVAAIARRTGAEQLVLRWGPPGALAEVVLPVERDGEVYRPTGAAVFADADRIAVAVSAEHPSGDPTRAAVGWLFFEP